MGFPMFLTSEEVEVMKMKGMKTLRVLHVQVWLTNLGDHLYAEYHVLI
jgi:hypothetical protein